MTNRLADESSPYLRQHAHNPVDWWPWCAEALAAARAADKPILLSIGYSACHWCHVMAHESFEDDATARVMNELFVCIKVDREERPDLDRVYQLAHQALTRHGGGWPLTVFLTPDDHLPFYAGTYFPNESRHGMPPFTHVLREVRRWWDERREEVRAQNGSLAEFLAGYDRDAPTRESLTDAPLQTALRRIEQGFDVRHGGHLGAPKFPHCPELELLRQLGRMDLVEPTLTRMAEGGIHDQIGGGFCRYSVDERWEIPHFEKMLYDNAQLLPLYAESAGCARAAEFRCVATRLIDWLQREMTAPDGGFYSALDADSEGEEGKYYVWQADAVRDLLDAETYAVAAPYYGFDRPANFEHRAWHARVAEPLASIADRLSIGIDAAEARLCRARGALLAARERRVRPGLDDKVLTAWNALMISGLARTARAIDLAPAEALREHALDALYRHAWRDGRLFAGCGGNVARLPGYLDDHVLLLDALIESLQSRWNARDLDWAQALAEILLARFEDRDGGFFFTAHDHERLIQRSRPWVDEALPSGNGVAVRALLRLGHLLGETRYLDAAERTLHAAWPMLEAMPQACCTLLRGLDEYLRPRTHVVVRVGSPTEHDAWRQATAAARRTDPHCDVYLVPADARNLPGALSSRRYADGGLAYVCHAMHCRAPIAHPAELAAALAESD